jgi:hypothetical protein
MCRLGTPWTSVGRDILASAFRRCKRFARFAPPTGPASGQGDRIALIGCSLRPCFPQEPKGEPSWRTAIESRGQVI